MDLFRFHIITSDSTGMDGCMISNDYLDGMVDEDGNSVQLVASVVAPPFIQQLLGIHTSNLDPGADSRDAYFRVPRRAVADLMKQVFVFGGQNAYIHISPSATFPKPVEACADSKRTSVQSITDSIKLQLSNLLQGNPDEIIKIRVQLLLDALGIVFFDGWDSARDSIIGSN